MRLRLLVAIMALTGLVGCDHATKHWAESSLRAAGKIELLPQLLDLRYTQNHDVGFSLLRHIPAEPRYPLMILFGVMATALLVGWWMRRRRELSLVQHLAFAMLGAGALGNLIDRVARGYVVDFIHLHHWPVFNVADVAIVMGAALLLLYEWRGRPTPATGPPPPPPAPRDEGPPWAGDRHAILPPLWP